MMKVIDLARQAYEGFREHADRNKPDPATHMPSWDDLPFELRVAWQIAILRTIDNLFALAKHELLRDE